MSVYQAVNMGLKNSLLDSKLFKYGLILPGTVRISRPHKNKQLFKSRIKILEISVANIISVLEIIFLVYWVFTYDVENTPENVNHHFS